MTPIFSLINQRLESLDTAASWCEIPIQVLCFAPIYVFHFSIYMLTALSVIRMHVWAVFYHALPSFGISRGCILIISFILLNYPISILLIVV